MKKEIMLCDVCKKVVAETECYFCGKDICAGKECSTQIDYKTSLNLKSGEILVKLSGFKCSSCNLCYGSLLACLQNPVITKELYKLTDSYIKTSATKVFEEIKKINLAEKL